MKSNLGLQPQPMTLLLQAVGIPLKSSTDSGSMKIATIPKSSPVKHGANSSVDSTSLKRKYGPSSAMKDSLVNFSTSQIKSRMSRTTPSGSDHYSQANGQTSRERR